MATYSGAVTSLGGFHVGRYDYFHGVGDGFIAATVKTKATPVDFPAFCKVWLFRFDDWALLAAQWTDPVTGAYRFENLSTDYAYSVVAVDPANNYRALIADNLTLANGGLEIAGVAP